MRKFGITFSFYAKEHFKKKSLIINALFVLATVGIIFAIDHFGGNMNYQDVAIVQESSTFRIAPELFESIDYRNFHFVNNEEEARTLLDSGEVTDIFIISGEERPVLTAITTHLNADSKVMHVINQTLTSIQAEKLMHEHDLTLDVVMQLLNPVDFGQEIVDEEGQIASLIIGQLIPFIIYFTVLMSGQVVANSVAAEKSSRVMEVMLGKVHPTITMISKVFASLVGILMPIISIILGVVLAQVLGFVDLMIFIEIINDFFPVSAILLTILMVILGYFVSIFLFAAAGAISNSVESLTTTLTPVTYLTMIPFFMVMFLPLDGAIMNVFIYVPFVAPYAMVQRYLEGMSSPMEMGISILLMIIFSVAMLLLSARLYMNGISHTSEKVTLKDLRQMLQK